MPATTRWCGLSRWSHATGLCLGRGLDLETNKITARAFRVKVRDRHPGRTSGTGCSVAGMARRGFQEARTAGAGKSLYTVHAWRWIV